jgi:hypothetical protein
VLVLVVEAHRDPMGPDLVRPLRSTCFVRPPVFSQSIPASKTKYGLIAFHGSTSTIDQGSKAILGKSSQENKILTDCRAEDTGVGVDLGLASGWW